MRDTVIGAGVAGLTPARRIAGAGHSVTVIDTVGARRMIALR